MVHGSTPFRVLVAVAIGVALAVLAACALDVALEFSLTDEARLATDAPDDTQDAVAPEDLASHAVSLPPYAWLDGVPLAEDQRATVNGRRPVAVMVDNLAFGARPQVGLDQADLVYEMLVEGGITRFMAVYLRGEPEGVQPVRSVRTPFLYLAVELGAIVAHDGAAELEGDADAGRQMREWAVPHIDQEHFKPLFRRDSKRRAPHNLVTELAPLRAEAETYGVSGPGTLAMWLFKDDGDAANVATATAAHVAFGFNWGGKPLPDFNVEWHYDASMNGYRRWTAGRPHVDGRSGAQLTAKNVVVQFDHAAVADRHGHVLYSSVGEGPAHIFLDGKVIEATWRKPSREERTRYFDATGEEIHFNRGATWVAVLPYGSPLHWK